MNDRRRFLLACALVFALFVVAALAPGCALPQWRVGQAKLDPKLAEKPPAQAEAERRAAALLVDLSATPTANPVGRIAQIHADGVNLQ